MTEPDGGQLGGAPDAGAVADAGTPPDAGMTLDGGVSVNPCTKCTASQTCIDQMCVNNSDISGRACASASPCPKGFSCAGDICVKDGSSFCQSVKGTNTVCADFKRSTPIPPGQWTVSQSPSGQSTVSTVSDASRASTKVLSCNIPRVSGQPLARIGHLLPSNWSSFEATFDIKITPMSDLDRSNGYYSCVELLCRSSNPNAQQEYQGVWWQVYYQAGYPNVSQLVMPVDKSADSFFTPLKEQPKADTCHRITLEESRSNGQLTGSVTVDGKGKTTHTGAAWTGDWRFELGTVARDRAATALYDNVLIRYSP